MMDLASQLLWSSELVQKYSVNGPRYTSYPTALSLLPDFPASAVQAALAGSAAELCLYLHIPFCQQLCYYCGCNKIVTRHSTKADLYLLALEQEMGLYQHLLADKTISQLHLGGGTPTFLTEEQLSLLMQLLRQHFVFKADAELSVEIDPRSCSLDKLAHLRELGFSRLSFGVQDFDEQVQVAINRVQSEELVRVLVLHARALGFSSINLDLVYGLPYQQATSFAETLDKVLELDPDRVSLFSYAHMPTRFAAQRKIPTRSLPQAEDKLALLQLAIERFSQAGYQCIGMDHFAKATDKLAIAQQQGKLQRNFQGYTTAGQDALVGLGVSSISQVNGVIWQNQKDLQQYQQQLALGQWPVDKGLSLTRDDKIRAALISQLICHFELDIPDFCLRFGLTDFWDYFADVLPKLEPLRADALVSYSDEHIQVTALGRLLVRIVCACFDRYLAKNDHLSYSKVV
ncbi:oxygen-independent coproporphyrinogen III oxidase [Rheinheimera sediminis]|uniref:oxygen-independent coproporphyrinogen III oxidase n=1 Tax=Rheinheimera sp. YQF-1 TaxID=2499626 RepID=UPI000FDBB9A4|nr:oxygen-independent coproporphyrinogen III oxidase [Rheinheimera sp. YQF-1]RVT45682.1 oxygen-independent coproporphyrinogen III oxidase [Rheinheimera sp. YQF-1]